MIINFVIIIQVRMKIKNFFKRTCAIGLSLLMFLSIIPNETLVKSYAANESDLWDGKSIEEPSNIYGTYKIDTAEKLAWFAQKVNNQTDFTGKKICITGNINLDDKNWTPIGNLKNRSSIASEVSIENCKISGLKVQAIYGGLFGNVKMKKLEVRDLTIESSKVSNADWDSVLGTLGGIIEIESQGSLTIAQSEFSGKLTNQRAFGGPTGGIVGTLILGDCSQADIQDTKTNFQCDSGNQVGALFAVVQNPSMSAEISITDTILDDDLKGYTNYGYDCAYVGGAIGTLQIGTFVMNCVTIAGSLYSHGYFGYAGGIIGNASYNTMQVENIAVNADIKSEWRGVYGYLESGGGFLGSSSCKNPENSYIKNSYFSGTLNDGVAFCTQCESATDTITIKNCYFDKDTTGLTDGQVMCVGYYTLFDNKVIDSKGLTTEQMKTQESYEGWDFEIVWKIVDGNYPELRTREERQDIEIVKKVSEYTTDELYSQLDKIMQGDYSEDVKYQLVYELFALYGITDVKEGIEYLSNTTSKRYAYLALTTDEMYMASNYQQWLDHTAQGRANRALLIADGLIFNNELNDWLDFSTYMESDYPGVAKYKAMLYDFMDQTQESIEIQTYIKMFCDAAKKGTETGKLRAYNIVESLEKCKDWKEAKKILNSAETQHVYVELVENNKGELSYKLDEKSGFGQFAKYAGKTVKTINFLNMTYSEIVDWANVDAKLAAYSQYHDFLEEIITNKEYIPFQLRWAAQQVLDELEANYLGNLYNIAMLVIENTDILKDTRDTILKKVGCPVEGLNDFLLALNVEAFFVNKIADIGEIVKREAYVEAYAYLASAFSVKLQNAKNEFLKSKTSKNAWNFYYYYNLVYNLRYNGEQAYLKMCKVEGLISLFTDLGYSIKEEAINDTLKILDDKCKFTFGEKQEIPESKKYDSKMVIKCPVDVLVYDEDGQCIAELKDKVCQDETNEFGRFAVTYDGYLEEYVKTICLSDSQKYTIQVIGNDSGLVSIDYANANSNNMYEISNQVIHNKDKMLIDIKEIESKQTYQVELNGENNYSEGKWNKKNQSYLPIEKLSLNKNNIELKEGESELLQVEIVPENASSKMVVWKSTDPNVAMVADGKVWAIKEGIAKIVCISLDDGNLVEECAVQVLKKSEGESNGGQNSNIKDDLSENNEKSDNESVEKPNNDISSSIEQTEKKYMICSDSKEIAFGKKMQLVLKKEKEVIDNKNIIWSSSNPKYLIVDEKGIIKAKKAGIGKKVKVTAKLKTDDSKEVSITFKVMKNTVKKIVIKNHPKIFFVDEAVPLKTSVITSGKQANKKLKWTSSNSKYATVNSKGTVIAQKAGKGKTVTITVKSTDGSNKKCSIKIKIK